MSLLDRIIEAVYKVQGGSGAVTDDVVKEAASAVSPQMNLTELVDAVIKERAANGEPTNRLDIYKTQDNLYSYYSNLMRAAVTNNGGNLPPHGDPSRDWVLSKFWKNESILSGAVYSMSAKMSTLSWVMMGNKRLARYYADLYSGAYTLNGAGWGDFISATAQDFYTTDRGAFWLTEREGDSYVGRLREVVHLDALSVGITGNMKYPIMYASTVTGQTEFLRRWEYAHFASMPSPREEMFGNGFCAVSRAYRSARILLGLADYDLEKLNNLPPEGVAAITGLTRDEFLDSLDIWKTARTQNNSLTYPMVLWLLSSVPNTSVGVDFSSFSQLPESFDRKSVVEQYVNILALDFGVDAREFWPVSTSSLGTAAESEIQHMKAKGKGPGEFVAGIERWINRELPEGVEFQFDTQDVGEDQIAASIAKGWVDALMPLYNPGGGGTPPSKTPLAPGLHRPEGGASQSNLTAPEGGGGGVEPLLTKQEMLRLLVDRRVLPNWLVGDNRVIQTDTGITEKEGEDYPIKMVWKAGKLMQEPHPAYTLIRNGGFVYTTLPLAVMRQDDTELFDMPVLVDVKSNIKGVPIPEREALRGPRITQNTVKMELELWANTPELVAYVPTPDEEEYTQVLLSVVDSKS